MQLILDRNCIQSKRGWRKAVEKRDQKPYLRGGGHHVFFFWVWKIYIHTFTQKKTTETAHPKTSIFLPNLQKRVRRAGVKRQCQTYKKHKQRLLSSLETHEAIRIGSPTSWISPSNKTANGQSSKRQHQISNQWKQISFWTNLPHQTWNLVPSCQHWETRRKIIWECLRRRLVLSKTILATLCIFSF